MENKATDQTLTQEQKELLIGFPAYFDKNVYLKAVESMICADELETALYMLDHMPAWYREHGCLEAMKMKADLMRQLWAAQDYVQDQSEENFEEVVKGKPQAEAFTFPRYPLVRDHVLKLNEKGITPHIHEVGPASYWMPLWLIEDKCKFTYCASSLQKTSMAQAKERFKGIWLDSLYVKDAHRIFLALEVIEHLWKTDELYQYYVKTGGNYDTVFVSTPHGTCFNGLGNWRDRDLGHLRCYTPLEFHAECNRLFPNYEWKMSAGTLMVCKGEKHVK